MIIPKHLFEDYTGAKSREAPTNLKPVGTGPYKFVDFKPGDMVRGEINPNYHVPNQPYFDAIEMKGGGDAVSAARAVLQTGEFDFAWNLQVEDEILKRLEKGGKGQRRHRARRQHRAHPAQHHRPVDRGRRRAREHQDQASDPHATRRCARRSRCWSTATRSQKYIYGRTGIATRELRQRPGALPLDEHEVRVQHRQGQRDARRRPAGRRARDGIRAKDGKKLKFVFQTSINRRARRRRRSSSRPARRPASTSS